jgi:hypothetical protein
MQWRGHFASGVSQEELGMGFAGSAEHIALFGSADDAIFINRLYTIALGRTADADGREAWTQYLASGASRGAESWWDSRNQRNFRH